MNLQTGCENKLKGRKAFEIVNDRLMQAAEITALARCRKHVRTLP